MTTMLLKFKFALLIMVLSIGTSLVAQNGLETANKQYELQAYNEALKNYSQLLIENPDCLECQLKVADLYRVLHNPEKAQYSYEKAMLHGGLKGKYLLGYGHTLKALKKYEAAKIIYEEFGQANPVVGSYFSRSCDVAMSYMDGDITYTDSPFSFNTVLSDRALTVHNGNLIFTSYLPSKFESHQKGWLKQEGDLLIVEGGLGNAPMALRNLLTGNNDVNAITYSADNSMCILSKTTNQTHISPVIENESAKSLFVSTNLTENGDFSNETAFIHNQTGSSTTHPTLSIDGKTLYFSSNRDGGFGGFDIYVSSLENGAWSSPINLGPSVNTAGNEITPAVSIDGSLMFASDYHMGLGGYDIFKTVAEASTWSTPTNLGLNVNTSSDDYMPVLDFAGNIKYLTSNRAGTKGGSDIYEINMLGSRDMVNADVSEPMDLEIETVEDDILDPEPIFVMNEETNFEIKEIEALDGLEDVEVYVANDNEMPKAYVIPKYKSSDMDRDPNLKTVSFESKSERIPANAYFVQLASISRSNANFVVYQKASVLGNVYKIYKDNFVKIRVGYYGNRSEAVQVLTELKRKGFTDAFITNDNLNMGEIELIYSSFDNFANENSTTYTEDYTSDDASVEYSPIVNASNYKVRLAAYDNPLFFDVAAVKGIAKLEQWSKGDWTIFLLGGFTSLEQAESAKIKAINRGFIDAYIVVDNGGVLEKLSRN